MNIVAFLETLFIPIFFTLAFIVTPLSLFIGIPFGFLYSLSARKLLALLKREENPPQVLNYYAVINYFNTLDIGNDNNLIQLRAKTVKYYRIYFIGLAILLISLSIFIIYFLILEWLVTKSPFEALSWLISR